MIDGEKLVQQWQRETEDAKRERTFLFLRRLVDLCQQYHCRLVYSGCGSHEIAVEEDVKLGSDMLEDFDDEARRAVGLPSHLEIAKAQGEMLVRDE